MKKMFLKQLMLMLVLCGLSHESKPLPGLKKTGAAVALSAAITVGAIMIKRQYDALDGKNSELERMKFRYGLDVPFVGDPKLKCIRVYREQQSFYCAIYATCVEPLVDQSILWGGYDAFDKAINSLGGKTTFEAKVIEYDQFGTMIANRYLPGSSYAQLSCRTVKELRDSLKDYEEMVTQDLQDLCQHLSVSFDDIDAVVNCKKMVKSDQDLLQDDLSMFVTTTEASEGLCDYRQVQNLMRQIQGGQVSWKAWFCFADTWNRQDVKDLAVRMIKIRKAIMQLRWVFMMMPNDCEIRR